MKKTLIEITVQDIFSVKAAIQGGADRIELCTALGVAGLTPSIGVIERAVETAAESGIKGFVDVLIRPREGDFMYDQDEIATAVRDIRRAVAAGVDGVVIGALRQDGTINRAALLSMMEAAEGIPVVFHRAFDVLNDQFTALEELIELGVVRVLTSGGAPKTREGIPRLKEIVRQADGRIEIMAGGGVKIEDIGNLVEIGVDAVHLSARCSVIGGFNRPGEKASYFQVDEKLVREAVAAAEAARSEHA